jgi:hypothetical protein
MDTNTLARELLALEHRYWDAIKSRDIATAESLTDYPCVVAGSHGVASVDRETFASMMGESKSRLTSYALDDVTVRPLGDDVAVVAYRVHEELTLDGEPLSLDASDASTWVRRDGRWLCAAHTESLQGDPYGRDRRSKA